MMWQEVDSCSKTMGLSLGRFGFIRFYINYMQFTSNMLYCSCAQSIESKE